MDSTTCPAQLGDFLAPFRVDVPLLTELSNGFSNTFTKIASDRSAPDQFLPTPILESMLRRSEHEGRYLAIDIGGTNLRVGFIELVGSSQLRRVHEKNWPIPEAKKQSATDLFNWIGECIAAVVRESYSSTSNGVAHPDTTLPTGVTFSFPVEQHTLADAKITALGKGFTVERGADLPVLLITGYDTARTQLLETLPRIDIAAIANDSVSTLVSFVYEFEAAAHQKAVMGLICGTGTNATLPMRAGMLGDKTKHLDLAAQDSLQDGANELKLVVNTEWSINGSAPPLLHLITPWDKQLDSSIECPGFQPLEYMVSGRYLGELCRLVMVDYITSKLGQDPSTLPSKLLEKLNPRKTTFLSHFRPSSTNPNQLVELLNSELPSTHKDFKWTQELAVAFYHVAKTVEVRAAGIIASAIIGLLDSAGEINEAASKKQQQPFELVVGYTGGCINNFQDYLADCQQFLDDIMAERGSTNVRAKLWPCDDGGIKGAGILVPAALAARSTG